MLCQMHAHHMDFEQDAPSTQNGVANLTYWCRLNNLPTIPTGVRSQQRQRSSTLHQHSTSDAATLITLTYLIGYAAISLLRAGVKTAETLREQNGGRNDTSCKGIQCSQRVGPPPSIFLSERVSGTTQSRCKSSPMLVSAIREDLRTWTETSA